MKAVDRFTDRVADYVRYRPDYPREVIAILKEQLGLGPSSVVADLGSGTGIFSAQLLSEARLVYGVEPNAAMRAAAAPTEARFPGKFVSIDGTAEKTTLDDASVDLVVAAQAFHWFDVAATRAECRRILRGRFPVGLVWNERDGSASPFMAEYERLLERWAVDYPAVKRSDAGLAEKMNMFFSGGEYGRTAVASHQELDLPGLRGRLLSSSYGPKLGHPHHEPLMKDLAELFVRRAVGGRVRFQYRTGVYTGFL